jgi:uncharacterized protein
LIYFDSSALLKFVKRDTQTQALRTWRSSLAASVELVTSELAGLEIARTLLRAGVEHQRVPYITGQALRGVYVVDVTSTVLARARGYGIRRLGSLDAVHLATADPFRGDLTDFVTYDNELTAAAAELGLPTAAPA